MPPLIIPLIAGLSVALAAYGLTQMLFGRRIALRRRLASFRDDGPRYGGRYGWGSWSGLYRRAQAGLAHLGEQLVEHMRLQTDDIEERLTQAGFRHSRSVPIFLAARVLSALGGTWAAMAAAGVFHLPAHVFGIWALGGAMLGWMAPNYLIRRQRRRRQGELRRVLPDAIDLLVVCVEAGLGMNQAFMRLAGEIEEVSPILHEELTQINLEMQTGTPRRQALDQLAERTGLQEVRSLVSMLQQTDRFGTSIAQSLRVEADALREQRRQTAEEKAARTEVRVLIPLILFIFPAILVILVGPALFQVFDLVRGMG